MPNNIEFQTPIEIMKNIASRIKQERIAQNITQENFSIKCGVTLNTYKRLENTGKCTLENLIAVLISLGKVNEIADILKPIQFSPKQAIKSKTKIKKRASGTNKMIDSTLEDKDIAKTDNTVISSILSKFKDDLEN